MTGEKLWKWGKEKEVISKNSSICISAMPGIFNITCTSLLSETGQSHTQSAGLLETC